MSYQLSVISLRLKRRSGQLLLELLVTIGVVAAIGAIVAQIVYVSLKSNQTGSEKNVGVGLAEAEFDSVRSTAVENWVTLYNLNHGTGTTTYYAAQSSGKWTITTTGTESISVNGDTYSRSFYVQNVCRAATSSAVTGISDTGGSATSTCTTSGGVADPSTQKVTVSVSWQTGGPVSYGDYLTRWRNLTCAQSSWTSQTSTVSACPASTYTSSTNVTTGGNLQLCAGGC